MESSSWRSVLDLQAVRGGVTPGAREEVSLITDLFLGPVTGARLGCSVLHHEKDTVRVSMALWQWCDLHPFLCERKFKLLMLQHE